MPAVLTALRATTPPVFQVDLNKTFGPIVIGVLVACGLYGASCVQALVYFITNPTDNIWFKTLVIVNILLGGADVVALVSVVYDDLVVHFGNVTVFATVGWGAQAEALLTTLIVLLIQSFFLFRLFRFTRSWIIVVITAPFILVTLGLGLTTAGRILRNPASAKNPNYTGVLHANDIFLAVTDLLLAGLMAYYLYKSKPDADTRIKSTDKVISTLIAYALATGALTGAIAFIGFILAIANPTNTSSEAIYAILPHTYTNAMLASLNLRQIATKPWRHNEAVELSGFRAQSGQTDSTRVGGHSQNSKLPPVSLYDSSVGWVPSASKSDR